MMIKEFDWITYSFSEFGCFFGNSLLNHVLKRPRRPDFSMASKQLRPCMYPTSLISSKLPNASVLYRSIGGRMYSQ